MTLLELMRKHRTDKAEHCFDIPYSYFLDDHRHNVMRVLEIGVKKRRQPACLGGLLPEGNDLWHRYQAEVRRVRF